MNGVKAIISLGSNLGNRAANLKQAIEKLIELRDIQIEKCSSVYETAPWGYSSENLFYNAIVSVKCQCSAHELMDKLMKIEQEMGRLRHSKSYSDRIIDLDIIDFDNCKIDDSFLTLPHPRYASRLFVLIPLKEIESDWIDVNSNKTIDVLLKESEDKAILQKLEVKLCNKRR